VSGVIEAISKRQVGAVAPSGFVKNGGAVGKRRARPGPVPKILFQRPRSGIAIEIAGAVPTQRRLLHVDFDPRDRCDRPPVVTAAAVELGRTGCDGLRVQRDPAFKPDKTRHRQLIDIDRKPVAVPVQGALTDCQSRGRLRERRLAPLGERPVFSARTIKRDIDRAMVKRIAIAAPARCGVIGRKDAADEGNDRQPMRTIVTQRVDIPPRITVTRDRRVEARSAVTHCAASRPDIAAIGTPGPGCVLPPAR